jgi:N-formylglutamate amidohydrolase
MAFATFDLRQPSSAVLATAVHAGHEVRLELASRLKVDDAARLREEDPYTGSLAAQVGSSVVVNRSRFEVDLNRERDAAVYLSPDDAWGIPVWHRQPSRTQIVESLGLYDQFYDDLAAVLDDLVAIHGGFVLYDVHSYNHRRAGPEAEPEPTADNPVVNLGTGSLPDRWKAVADVFVESMSAARVSGEVLDVRPNVRFEGRQVTRWVHDRYGDRACAFAIEFKKVFMDEWTGDVDEQVLLELGDALSGTVEPVVGAWAST